MAITCSSESIIAVDTRAIILKLSLAGTTGTYTTKTPIDGMIYSVEIDPGTAPTADYDITLVDSLGLDVMGGSMANLSATVTQERWPLASDGTTIVQPLVKGALTVTVANQSETATFDLYIKILKRI